MFPSVPMHRRCHPAHTRGSSTAPLLQCHTSRGWFRAGLPEIASVRRQDHTIRNGGTGRSRDTDFSPAPRLVVNARHPSRSASSPREKWCPKPVVRTRWGGGHRQLEGSNSGCVVLLSFRVIRSDDCLCTYLKIT